MRAKIYQPVKTAMQSGKGNTKNWVLEFIPESTKVIDTLMGWTGSGDMQTQLKLKFVSLDDAKKYAEANKIDYVVLKPETAKLKKQAYAENFTRADVYSRDS